MIEQIYTELLRTKVPHDENIILVTESKAQLKIVLLPYLVFFPWKILTCYLFKCVSEFPFWCEFYLLYDNFLCCKYVYLNLFSNMHLVFLLLHILFLKHIHTWIALKVYYQHFKGDFFLWTQEFLSPVDHKVISGTLRDWEGCGKRTTDLEI